jgi:tetrahydromethanopterin S-methyltransferase subunit D
LYVALDGAGNDGTDAGSSEDGVNKGSDGDGRDGASDSMLLYLLCLVLFWIHSVLIPTSRLYVAVGGAGNDGTDAGSREDCVNKGSDGDGRGGGSDGMLLYLLRLVLFWIYSVLILISCLYVAVGGAGNDGTDAGSHGDGANKGSDGDGRGGGSDGMLIVVFGFGIILDSFCSHTPTTS